MKAARCSVLKKQKRSEIRLWASELFWWTAGSFLFSAAINVFTAPNEITVGGFSGIATVLNYLFGLPIGLCVFVLNIPFFIAAFSKFGFDFVLKTVIATFEVSLFIDLLSPFLRSYSSDRLLCSIFGGVLLGAGLGLIFRHGATTGGTDIIAKLLKLKFAHLSTGRLIFIIDLVIILLSSFVYGNLESVLYALVTLFVSAQAVDLAESGFSHSKSVFIVTENAQAVSGEIISSLGRGVTVLNAVGGYTGKEKQLLFCAVRANEVIYISKILRENDANSFMTVTDAEEIIGNGFNKEKLNF